jgi:hypothetical protein
MIQEWALTFGAMCGTFILGMGVGAFIIRNQWRDEMIKRGHARFHWENAKWFWIEDLPPPPPDPAARKVVGLK